MTTPLALFFFIVLIINVIHALPVFSSYGTPNPNYANLDLDLRSIIAQTGLVTEAGMQNAQTVYSMGGGNSPIGLTIQSLITTNSGLCSNITDSSLAAAFRSFYGGDSDADQWMNAAFDGTTVALGTRLIEFGTASLPTRTSAARYGALTLNILMALECQIFQAVDATCNGLGVDNVDAQLAWDAAYALYTGSEAELEEGFLGGYFIYSLSQTMCVEFGTCKHDSSEARINTDALQLFVTGRADITNGRCADIREKALKIQALSRVPIIQGLLRALYAIKEQADQRDNTQGEVFAMAAAVAPMVSQCSTGSGDIIFKDTGLSNGSPEDGVLQGSFVVVKSAIESAYNCLGIRCSNVGGIVTLSGDGFLAKAQACGGVQPVAGAGLIPSGSDGESPKTSSSSSNKGPSGGAVAGIIIAILIVVIVVIVGALMMFKRKRAKQSDSTTTTTTTPPSEDDEAVKTEEETTIETREIT